MDLCFLIKNVGKTTKFVISFRATKLIKECIMNTNSVQSRFKWYYQFVRQQVTINSHHGLGYIGICI